MENITNTSSAKVICENTNNRYNYFAWPTVARLPDGRLAAVSSGYRIKHCDPFGKLVISYSDNEGKTWSKPVAVIDTPLDDRDGGIAVSGKRVIVTTFNNTVEFQRNVNETENKNNKALYNIVALHLNTINAKTAEEKYLGSLYAISEDGGNTFGEIKKIPISAPHGPAVMPNGRFVYVGTYFGVSEENAHNASASVACYIENGDGGFEFASEIPNISSDIGYSCEPHCIVLPDGKIIVHIRFQRFVKGKGGDGWEEFTLYQSESTDGGKSFSVPRQILPSMGGAPAHLMRHSSGALISSYAYREYAKELPSKVCAIISHDEGKTWEKRVLCQGTHSWDMGYTSSVEKKDGSILSVFYDHKENNGPAVIKQIEWSL